MFLAVHGYVLVGSVADPDPHLKSPPGSAWRDADRDPGGKKAYKMYRFIR